VRGLSEVLDQGYQPPLGVAVAIDISLRGLDRAMTSEQLNIAQGATRCVHQSSCPSYERAATRMGRAALQIERFERAVKPDNDTKRRHCPTLLRPNYRSLTDAQLPRSG